MNVGELKQFLAQFSDDVSVVIRTKDVFMGEVDLTYEDAHCREAVLSMPRNASNFSFWDDYNPKDSYPPVRVALVTWAPFDE